ncbi:hypothetical protein P872_01845 [Rhodonellum psychrophilum GCM71 = DSM 17998]|uniref:Histidine kinase N-terminal 7TM region domain-containing protein n=2 Tax=Rhodonellum TaxID=336827 RepID=U5C4D8_9BACT|nr:MULTISPECIES: hypothetical protein [Rhodonellum]ERM83781.1 hypothetical protein P872_01845 [Rhodonellum psychrophilum GCM71 = DSM 17998]SDY65120.1 hypothetical protein SAMN05444412_102109 [Rhodonellum ikkaensis]
MISNLYLISIGFSLVAAFVFYGIQTKNQDKTQIIILGILGLVFSMEFVGAYTASKGINNSLLYNIGWVYLESMLLLFYFLKIEKNSNFKKVIENITYGILIWGLINTVFFQSISSVFQFYSLLPFSALIIFLCLRFLVKVWNFEIFSDSLLISLPHFWIVVGMLFFYLEATIFFGMFQFFPEQVIESIKMLGSLNRFLAGIMYLFFGLSYFIPYFTSKKINFNT